MPDDLLPEPYKSKKLIPEDALTKPFYLKATKLNDDLLIYLRTLL